MQRPTPSWLTRRPDRHSLAVGGVVLATVVGILGISLSVNPTFGALTAKITNSTDTAGTRTFFTCRNAVTSVGQANSVYAFAMEPTGGTSETDLTGNTGGRYYDASGKAVTPTRYSTDVGCNRDSPATAVSFAGNRCLASTLPSASALSTFTVEAWFKTGSTTNGKIIGFGASANSPVEASYDRHVYIDASGKVVFGTYNNGFQTISTSGSFADSKWHHMVATFAPSTATLPGMRLYLDGALAASNAAYSTAETTSGFWKVGCGNLRDWPNVTGTTSTINGYVVRAGFFTGQLQYVAVYRTVLSAPQVLEHHLAGAG